MLSRDRHHREFREFIDKRFDLAQRQTNGTLRILIGSQLRRQQPHVPPHYHKLDLGLGAHFMFDFMSRLINFPLHDFAKPGCGSIELLQSSAQTQRAHAVRAGILDRLLLDPQHFGATSPDLTNNHRLACKFRHTFQIRLYGEVRHTVQLRFIERLHLQACRNINSIQKGEAV